MSVKSRLKWFSRIIVLCFLFFMSYPVMAKPVECGVSNPGVATYNMGEIIIPPGGVAKGTLLASKSVTTSPTPITMGTSCDLFARYVRGAPTGDKYYGTNDIYTTNIPGVGFVICQFGCSQTSIAMPYFVGTKNYNSPVNWNGANEFALVATGEPISSGALDAGTYGEVGLLPDMIALTFNVSSGTVKAVDCAINNSNIEVPFGNMPLNAFTGRGSVTESKGFGIDLNCDGKANVSITLEGSASADGDPTILALTGEGQPGVASGVGVQILYNGTPLNIGTNVPLTDINGGNQTITGLSVRYIQSQNEIVSGTANATAVLNMVFQ